MRDIFVLAAPAFALLAALLATPAYACDYPAGPPDAREARAAGQGIVSAIFTDATTIYRHGVLGDAIEAGALRVRSDPNQACPDHVVRLGDGRVFEDVTPRIADVTGDGLNDVIVIETRVDAGASLAIYGMAGGTFAKLAATPHIGRPNRWLAPAGIADFDGDGVNDVAYVETPHIGGILKIWSFAGGHPRELASAPDFSNHSIGENFITGGVRDCGNGPELVLPNADWSRTRLARFTGGAVVTETIGGNAAGHTIAQALACGGS